MDGSPLWLSHHQPSTYDRCAVIGGRHVCRRCLLLYPVAFLTLFLALAGVRWPMRLDPDLVIGLTVPGAAEFVGEHLGFLGYSRRLQAAVTVPLGVAMGVGFDRYVHRPTDPLWWSVALGTGALWTAAAVTGERRRR